MTNNNWADTILTFLSCSLGLSTVTLGRKWGCLSDGFPVDGRGCYLHNCQELGLFLSQAAMFMYVFMYVCVSHMCQLLSNSTISEQSTKEILGDREKECPQENLRVSLWSFSSNRDVLIVSRLESQVPQQNMLHITFLLELIFNAPLPLCAKEIALYALSSTR